MKIGSVLLVALLSTSLAAPTVWAGHHEEKGKKHEKAVGNTRKYGAKPRRNVEEAPEEIRAKGTKARHDEERAADAKRKGKGDEMRDRRDERKAIMNESKAAREPGTPQKGEKPWWKFWGNDEPVDTDAPVTNGSGGEANRPGRPDDSSE
jgi:hypothetical protein